MKSSPDQNYKLLKALLVLVVGAAVLTALAVGLFFGWMALMGTGGAGSL